MLISKKNRQVVFNQLFEDGVMVAPKDLTLPKHPHLEVPNLEVVMLLRSLTSKGLVSQQYSWRWFYWTLTEKGIETIREYLHLPADVVPGTLKKSNKPMTNPRFGGDRESRPRREFSDRPPRGDRPPRDGDKTGAPADYKPSFRREGGERREGGDRRGPRPAATSAPQ